MEDLEFKPWPSWLPSLCSLSYIAQPLCDITHLNILSTLPDHTGCSLSVFPFLLSSFVFLGEICRQVPSQGEEGGLSGWTSLSLLLPSLGSLMHLWVLGSVPFSNYHYSSSEVPSWRQSSPPTETFENKEDTFGYQDEQGPPVASSGWDGPGRQSSAMQPCKIAIMSISFEKVRAMTVFLPPSAHTQLSTCPSVDA